MIDIERISEPDGRTSLWSVAKSFSTGAATDCYRKFLGYEQPVCGQSKTHAVCWAYGRTLGNIAVCSHDVLASLKGASGDDALIACDLVDAGKMRNGANRWWCRTHQVHWGTKADKVAAHDSGTLRCSNYLQPMSFVVDPLTVELERHAEVGVWCSMPPALTSAGIPKARKPRIHLHIRDEVGGQKLVDRDVEALAVRYKQAGTELFAHNETTTVHITPPAAFEFVLALESSRPLGYLECRHCGTPHLDLGEFGRIAHRKHLCGNCGRDSSWSKEPIASTPIKPLYDQFAPRLGFADVDRVLNIDEYPDAEFAAWASTPAVVWTSSRPQERGIHVHLGRGRSRLIDETFGTVIFRGQRLDRQDLLEQMIANTVV